MQINFQKLTKDWKKQLFIPTTNFEKKSIRSWKQTHIHASQNRFEKALREYDQIVVGDHRINIFQTVFWMNQLDSIVNKNWIFLTDRFDTNQRRMVEGYFTGQYTLKNALDHFMLQKPLDHAPEGGVGLLLKWLKRKKIQIQYIHPVGSFEDQTQKLYKKLSTLSRKNKVLVWTGSLKVSPVWPDMFYRSEKDPMLLNMDGGLFESKERKPWLNRGNSWIYVKQNPMLNFELTRLWKDEISYFVHPQDIRKEIDQSILNFQRIFCIKEKKCRYALVHPFEKLNKKILEKLEPKTQKFVEQRIRKMESAVIPKHRLIVISRLDKASLAEEAMHFLRMGKSTKSQFGPWVTIWEEAWGMFGSLLVDPQREIENKESKEVWESVHLMGYALGKSMFELWKENKKRRIIRDAFCWFTEEEKEAESFVEKMQILMWT